MKSKTTEHLQYVAIVAGHRVEDTLATDKPDVAAAAIVATLLSDLNHVAANKPLTAKDISLVREHFLKEAEMVERRDVNNRAVIERGEEA